MINLYDKKEVKAEMDYLKDQIEKRYQRLGRALIHLEDKKKVVEETKELLERNKGIHQLKELYEDMLKHAKKSVREQKKKVKILTTNQFEDIEQLRCLEKIHYDLTMQELEKNQPDYSVLVETGN